MTLGLLYIADQDPTDTSYAMFILTIYAGFPLTFLSQLTTGPMLDKISPEDQKGFVQAMDIVTMQFASAFAPPLIALL
eukprot:CAMPEP_0185788124 /NCGR_PEP_ID=MMETSP1174-20130828/144339_1 /TAXON_ID=35687 /ORGANISM="Dictyocha speculum, Strain CCMP1381" /LENGTH=77 /DNA_ID=CAMNT_0028481631 /DNA_START=94 /DNA_END=324 /DNA_ORIENTATION=-